ncbi:MAG: hypothetical protein ACTH1I_06195 [Brevibacterium aurantiacum]|uniref:Uncharacterized protein n=1 Tax=Brevibacterium aurantiacum TaxID=273384 RepID=A0A1D7W0D3_BREAU|nr:hypothetical protein [Brevibacterium aurantiacum]AOP52158.1 hypothetical protein BLSMQ_0440 [Brevibacterium aurantiacum]AZL04549.1 hypothetical protein CXR24_02230 [Brevibacterium aurantiacum]AZL08138.1 hypothetical protein CXR26_01955 [Brevibacterium aurantiacum]AZT95994.1 hypothetical protein CXR27_02420 [Brevibacterium aurantiacum]PCC52597.1 hypothetical protein CIK59_16010 [Brevibacterium aurantiacum]
MTVDRTELADSLAEATGWSVTADAHRVTFTNDDPPQVVIWTVTDAEIGELRYSQNLMAKSAGARQTADLGVLGLPLCEALGPFEGSRGYMHGTDLTISE